MRTDEVVSKIADVLRDNCEDPATEIIKLGKALVVIGEALRGLSVQEARNVVQAVSLMSDIRPPAPPRRP